MRDSLGRDLNYLRVSLTDRCNLRCIYCMPPEGIEQLSHMDVLRNEEFLGVIKVAADLGFSFSDLRDWIFDLIDLELERLTAR